MKDIYTDNQSKRELRDRATDIIVQFLEKNLPNITARENQHRNWDDSVHLIWYLYEGENDLNVTIQAIDHGQTRYRIPGKYEAQVVWVASGPRFPMQHRRMSYLDNYLRRDSLEALLKGSAEYMRGKNAQEEDDEAVRAALKRLVRPVKGFAEQSSWSLREAFGKLLDTPDNVEEADIQHQLIDSMRNEMLTAAANAAITDVLWDAHNRKFNGV